MAGPGKTRKRYSTPELKTLGDVAKLTREHTHSGDSDLPFGSQDEIKSGA